MAYEIPEYVDTQEQAILAVASAVKGEQVTGGDGSVNTALDILADALAGENITVPMTDQGAILALAQYVGGGGGGGEPYAEGLVDMRFEAGCAYVIAADADLQNSYYSSSATNAAQNPLEGSIATGMYIAILDDGDNVVCKTSTPSGMTPITKTKTISLFGSNWDVWQVPTDIDKETMSFVVTFGTD